jgi:PAS domain S-box-containing protein
MFAAAPIWGSGPSMRRNLRSWLVGYGGALAVTLLAAWLRSLFDPVLNDHLPYSFFFVAVLFSTWWGGLGPATLSLLCGLVLGSYSFNSPGSFALHTVEQQVGAGIYLLVGIGMIFFNESMLAARDRTEATARALRESEDRLRLAMESTALGTWDYNPVTRELKWSARCKSLFGVPPGAQVTYEVFLSTLHAEDRERTQRAVQRALDPASGGTFAIEHRTAALANGSERWLASRGRAYFDDKGRAVRFVGTVLDISERKQAEQALREAQRRKDEFMATLAHELRNPLAPIRNAFQAVRLKGSDPAVREWAEGVIERQVRHMSRLVDDLMDVSRISRGKVRLHLERFDLCRQVRTTAEDMGSAAEAAGLRLDVQVPPGPVWVRGDPMRLAQVVSNLLTNAIKFTDPGGLVGVRLEEASAGQEAAVTVSDTGIGIEPDMLARVFERFAQAERARERSRGGLGLGLALVRGLVELHGGRVRAHSDGPGRGSAFTFWLPVIQDPTPGAEGPVGPAPIGARRRILIIEDNQDTAASLRMLLELHGHEARLAHSGPAGLHVAREFHPDVVLCDIELPGMDGMAVARALREDPTTAKARLIALSGYSIHADQSEPAGFDLFLTKPVDLEELMGIIARQNGHTRSNERA